LAALNGVPVILAGDYLTSEQKISLDGIKIDSILRTGGGISDKPVNSIKGFLGK
jgi:hypothetical protein